LNLVLLENSDFIAPNRVRLNDRRLLHIQSVHKAAIGDQLRCGLINGLRGTAEIVSMTDAQVTLDIELNSMPPKALPVTLILALPRPKMVRRILQTSATLGIKKIYLVNAYRVDKSYWSTPILHPDSVEENFKLGLEQAGDTLMPELFIRKRFKPFVEDELPALAKDKRALIAHPYDATPCPPADLSDTLIAIGPEGGFIPYEIDLMRSSGLTAFNLGERILRVETAVTAIISKIFPLI
jgi:16S rRNA (uracil1498-N3)-methyltransferase